MTTTKRVLVLGWYDQSNLGDESFKRSFRLLWPKLDFTFSNFVPSDQSAFSGCFIGGGNFLDGNFPGLGLLRLPTAFVGIGVGGVVSPQFADVLVRAKAIVVRDHTSVRNLPSGIDPASVVAASDLFFARPASSVPTWCGPMSNKVSVLLSAHFMARAGAPDWFSRGWTNFSKNLATVLDILVERGANVSFLPMSVNRAHSDVCAADEVVGLMLHGQKVCSVDSSLTEQEVLQEISESSLTLSLRLHGMIFAASTGCPFVAFCGHDKSHSMARSMRWQNSLDIYTASWQEMLRMVDSAIQGKSVESGRAIEEARKQWLAVSDFVITRLWP